MNLKIKSLVLSSTMLAIAALGASPLSAQTTPGAETQATNEGQLGDIVVTAQRRKENLQSVPVAASVVLSESLTQRNVIDARDIAQVVPNLRIDTPYGNTIPKLSLRGVGSGAFNQNSEATVAIYLDDLVLNPVSSKLGQLFDLERVEVLRGPQGTLYGKNTTGGAINFVTRRPDGTTSANGAVTVARYGQYVIEAGAQTAISDTFSVRASFKRNYSDGYGFNRLTNHNIYDNDEWAGRLGLRYKSGGTDIYLKLFGDRSRAQGTYNVTEGVYPSGSGALTGAPTPTGINFLNGYTRPSSNVNIAEEQYQYSHIDNRGISLNIDQELGGDLTLSSISGYLFSKSNLAQDNDGSPFIFVQTEPYSSKVKMFSQELRLSSSKDQAFSWIIGATAFAQKVNYDNTADLTGFATAINTILGADVLPLGFRQVGQDRTSSFAAFVDATYKLTDQVSVFGGIRLTTDKKKFHQFPVNGISLIGPYDFRDSKRWTKPTYRAGVNFQATPDTMFYASYNHGYRSGTYDTSFVGTPDQVTGPINPEFVDSFEGGVKTLLFDRKLRLNVAGFYTKFKDQQLPIIGALGLCCSTGNAGKSRIYGLELEAVARITPDFDVNLSAAVTNGKYQKFETANSNGVLTDYAGAKLGNLADYEIRLSPEYRIPLAAGDVFIAPEALFVGKSRRSTTVDDFGQDVQPAYTIINGQLGYRFENNRYSIFAFVKNATNKRYLTDFANSPGFGFKQMWFSAPRTWGLTATASF